jgi:uncharacterized protein (TIGR02145 family)
MKKMIYLMLIIVMINSASTKAQVVIGGNTDSDPHPGAILDLQGTKGFLLSNVALLNVYKFQLADESTAASAKGMMIYNTSSSTIGGQGEGIYIWTGSQWRFLSVFDDGTVRVTGITVGGDDIVVSESQTQYTATVLPANATNAEIEWSITSTGGSSQISATGLFTAGLPGQATIRATAKDGTEVFGEKVVTINPKPATVLITGIVISAAGDTASVTTGEKRQLTATVTPANATNQALNWSITNVYGLAEGSTVDQSGLVSGSSYGRITVKATAQDGSGVSGEYDLAVVQRSGNGTAYSGKKNYKTYCYPFDAGCWMIENSEEGQASYTKYDKRPYDGRGYYYTWVAATRKTNSEYDACPRGFTIPSEKQWDKLISYINSANSTEKSHWMEDKKHSGAYSSTNGWYNYNDRSYWWGTDKSNHYVANPNNVSKLKTDNPSSYAFSLRCIQK